MTSGRLSNISEIKHFSSKIVQNLEPTIFDLREWWHRVNFGFLMCIVSIIGKKVQALHLYICNSSDFPLWVRSQFLSKRKAWKIIVDNHINIYTQGSQSCKLFILWKYNATLLSKYVCLAYWSNTTILNITITHRIKIRLTANWNIIENVYWILSDLSVGTQSF